MIFRSFVCYSVPFVNIIWLQWEARNAIITCDIIISIILQVWNKFIDRFENIYFKNLKYILYVYLLRGVERKGKRERKGDLIHCYQTLHKFHHAFNLIFYAQCSSILFVTTRDCSFTFVPLFRLRQLVSVPMNPREFRSYRRIILLRTRRGRTISLVGRDNARVKVLGHKPIVGVSRRGRKHDKGERSARQLWMEERKRGYCGCRREDSHESLWTVDLRADAVALLPLSCPPGADNAARFALDINPREAEKQLVLFRARHPDVSPVSRPVVKSSRDEVITRGWQ